MNLARFLLADRECFLRIRSGEDPIALATQNTGDDGANAFFIFDEKNGLSAPCHFWCVFFRWKICSICFLSWEIDFETRAAVRFTVHINVSIALFHDPIHCGQTKAGAFPRRFCGEKWLKDLRDSLRIHPFSRITHLQHDIITGYCPNMVLCEDLVQYCI